MTTTPREDPGGRHAWPEAEEPGMAEAGWAGDTIVGISTAPGSGAVGIVRLSGPDAIRVAESCFRAAGGRDIGRNETFSLVYGHVVEPDTGHAIDEALLAVMRGPRSYTREDVAELQCHGGAAAVRAVLGLMVRLGARMAEPGEFTRRAFLNGRIDLAQAESVAEIVGARSAAALRASVRQLEGGLSERVREARGELVGLLAGVEAAVDFSDEEVEEVDLDLLRAGLIRVQKKLAALLETAFVGRVVGQGARTAIIGKPNAGKSSLLNALVMRERAIVSEIPGTTRDTVEEQMEIGGIPICLVDTAGLRAGGDRVEQMGVERSQRAMEEADLVLVVVDLDASWDGQDRLLLGEGGRERWIVVGNKSDLVADPVQRLEELGSFLVGSFVRGKARRVGGRSEAEGTDMRMCAVSALNGEGIDGLRALIGETIVGEGGLCLEEPILANGRHEALVREAAESVSGALSSLDEGRDEELLCEDVRRAARALGRITGEELTEDVLDEIFSRFCLGK